MEGAAKLITAFAALLGAIAWPISIFSLAFLFRNEIKAAAGKLPALLDRVRKMKLAGIEADLDKIADSTPNNTMGNITQEEVEVAVKIAYDANQYDLELTRQLDRLCVEYDSLRKTLPAGPVRTKAMSRVLIKMRALAPSLVSTIDIYKNSSSPGRRLAAVAMMQMNPEACEIDWLTKRFEVEHPFIFYHAALALQNFVNDNLPQSNFNKLANAVQKSLKILRSFDGIPDAASIAVLEKIYLTITKNRCN